MNDRELSAQISNLLWHEDVMGIGKGIDSPRDEFDLESVELVQALKTSEDLDEFVEKVVSIFNKSFEPTLPYDFDNTKELAQKIYELMQTD